MTVLAPSQARLYAICSFVSIGGVMYGYDSGVLTACLSMPDFRQVHSIDTNNNAAVAIVISLAASFLASLASGFVTDSMGRKKFFYCAAVFHIVGSVIQMAGTNLGALLVGRVVTGTTVGMLGMVVPLYQSEVASPDNRGRLITLYQLGVTVGLCVSSWIGFGTAHLPNNSSWRVPIGIQIVPCGLLLLGLGVIPESPRWLIAQERYPEALSILARIRGYGDDTKAVEVLMEFTSIVQDVTFDRNFSSKKYLAVFKRGIDNYLLRTILGAGIHTFTQLTGINALLFYLPQILKSTGLNEADVALLGNGVCGAINVLGTIPVFFYVDRWDRRRILVIGALFMAACMVTVAGIMGAYTVVTTNGVVYLSASPTFHATVYTRNHDAAYAIIVLLGLFVAVFALSWGPAGWIYPAEIYPQFIRANAMGVTTASSYFCNMAITLVTPVLLESIQWGTYVMFGGFCFLMAWVVHRFYPETRGHSLEEVNLIFSGALVDKRPDVHHPETAAAALLQMEQIRYRNERDRLERAAQEFYPPMPAASGNDSPILEHPLATEPLQDAVVVDMNEKPSEHHHTSEKPKTTTQDT